MANIAVSYLIDSARAKEDFRGVLWTESYLVENVSGRRALLDALFAAGLPQYGDPLFGALNMFVIDRTPRPFTKNSTTQVIVDITYGPPSVELAVDTIVEFYGTTREIETSKYPNGQLIKVRYVDSGGHGGSLPEQVGRIRSTKALGILSFDFQVDDDPSDLEFYLNKVNSSPWRGRAAYTWKCIQCSIKKIFYRSGWRVQMAFEYDEETHIKTAFYRLLGGIIPKDIDEPVDPLIPLGNGWTNVLPSLMADFNLLTLPTTF